MAWLKANFYPDLTPPERSGRAGHWSHTVPAPARPYSAMPSSHQFWTASLTEKCFYIYRDGRDVVVSLWRSKMMQHPSWKALSLSGYLRRPLDWSGSPGQRATPTITVAEHWRKHLESWHARDRVCYVRYEDLLLKPNVVLRDVSGFLEKDPVKREAVSVDKRVGWEPHEGISRNWENYLNDADLRFFFSHVSEDFWGLWKTGD